MTPSGEPMKPVVVAVLMLVQPSAFAQSDPRARARTDDPRVTARMQAGPLYLTPSLTVSNLGFDTNVFNRSGDRQSDFTISVAPHVEVWLPFARRAMLSASVTPGYTYYQTFASERSFNPDLGVTGEVSLNRLTLFAEASYLNSRERPNFEIDVRSRRVEDSVAAGAEVRVFRKLYIEARGSQTHVDFDAGAFFEGTSLERTLNRRSRAVAGTVRWRWTPLSALVVRGAAERDRFELAPERDTDSTRLTAGFEFHPRALLAGEASVGLRRFQTLTDELPDFRGVVASASLTYRLLGSAAFSVTADRDVAYSFEPLQPYYLSAGYGVNVRRQLAGRLDGTLGLQRSTYAYRDLQRPGAGAPGAGEAAPVGPAGRVDVTWNYTASVGYRAGRGSRIGLGVSYWDRTSNTSATRDYSGLRAGIVADYGF